MKRVVVKVGSKVLSNNQNRILRPVLNQIVGQIAELMERGIQVILVSSGAVSAGKELLGKSNIEEVSLRRQMYSAIGQPRLMRIYYQLFAEYGLLCAQVLPTRQEFNIGEPRQNILNCYESLLSEGVVPIVNEDDATSITQTMFSDNDELAAMTADMIQADALVLLSDVEGFYNGHPDDKGTKIIHEIDANDDAIRKHVEERDKGEALGRGGMGSKLKAAQIAAQKGIAVYIAKGKRENSLLDVVDGKKVGTKIFMTK